MTSYATPPTSNTTRPTSFPPIVISKKTFGFDIVEMIRLLVFLECAVTHAQTSAC